MRMIRVHPLCVLVALPLLLLGLRFCFNRGIGYTPPVDTAYVSRESWLRDRGNLPPHYPVRVDFYQLDGEEKVRIEYVRQDGFY